MQSMYLYVMRLSFKKCFAYLLACLPGCCAVALCVCVMLQGGGLAEPAADIPPGQGSVQDMPGARVWRGLGLGLGLGKGVGKGGGCATHVMGGQPGTDGEAEHCSHRVSSPDQQY